MPCQIVNTKLIIITDVKVRAAQGDSVFALGNLVLGCSLAAAALYRSIVMETDYE